MKVIVADDEALARSRLRRLVQELDDYEIVGEAATGEEAVRLGRELSPEIVLLDIRMPGMNGLEAARHIADLEQPPAVIFTTAYDQHALEAFETHAVDYLLKPVRKARLKESLEKARRPNRAQLAGNGQGEEEARSHICARVRGALKRIPIDEIYYFLADQKYVSVRHDGGEVLIEDSLKSLEQEFGARFVRIHRKALVASRLIEGLERGEDGRHVARLRGLNERLEVSRRHLPYLRRALREGRIEPARRQA